VATTIPFHRQVLMHDDFRSGRVTTRWVEEEFLAATPIHSRQPGQSGMGALELR
jgi:pyruvate carboxylase